MVIMMKKRMLVKEFFRSIARSKARFFSILTIIAIGVGFFAGINATKPNMILSADQYYKDTNLSDIRIIAPLGLQKKDINKLNELDEVERIQEGYWKDLFLSSEEGYTSIVRLYSYDGDNTMNNILLKEGRLPEKR